jgi:uncharacterized protein YdaU (DUF1376 family)
MKLHSYPWYPDDWHRSETRMGMTMEERGLFRELIDYCWIEGSLPIDDRKLKLIAGASDDEWQRSCKAAIAEFVAEGERLHHWKVDARRPELLTYHNERAEAGRRGGRKRAEVQAQLKQSFKLRSSSASSSAIAEPQALLKPSLSLSTSLSTSYGADAEEFIAAYPRKTGTQIGLQTFISLIDDGEKSAVFAGLDRWKKSEAWTKDNGKWIPEPARWLTDRRWLEYPAPAQPTGGYETPPFRESF